MSVRGDNVTIFHILNTGGSVYVRKDEEMVVSVFLFFPSFTADRDRARVCLSLRQNCDRIADAILPQEITR